MSYIVLQEVTKNRHVHYFNIAQEIFLLKEGKKLLQHVTTSYNALQDVTKTAQSKD